MTHHHQLSNNDNFLLCDEVLDDHITPVLHSHDYALRNHDNIIHPITKLDVKHSFDTCVQKETKYMTGPGYVKLIHSNHFVAGCRSKAIRWFIHCQRRFDFCIGTVFNAVNYFDRFVDTNKCHGWSYMMMELLSLSAFSIAVKFGETCPPSLHQIQGGLEHSFEPKLIQKMEMKILDSLKWEVNSITPYSYVELIEWELKQQFKPIDRSRLDEILLVFSLDVKLLEYRPCVIAISALRCILEDEHCLSHITSFIPADQKKKIQSCYNKMQEILNGYPKPESSKYNASSPDTVLTKESQAPISLEQIDLSFIDGSAMDKLKKRKRVDDCVMMNKK